MTSVGVVLEYFSSKYFFFLQNSYLKILLVIFGIFKEQMVGKSLHREQQEAHSIL